MSDAYHPIHVSQSRFLDVRGLRLHARCWHGDVTPSAGRPLLVMLHGWMDVSASFQFVVDAMRDARPIVALDWRGFGLTESPPADAYWLADHLGDLDGALHALAGDAPVDLLGHSMGANVAMIYAGVRPKRVRRLVNLEGFGLPSTSPDEAPDRYARWLDQLREPMRIHDYADLDAVAQRLMRTNPLLRRDRALWLAGEWSRPAASASDGGSPRRVLLADPAHKRIHPILYQTPEVLACWRRIEAPVQWIEGDRTDLSHWWGERHGKAELHRRLDVVASVERHVVAPAAHMLHHDQPEAVAARVEGFLG